MRLHAHGCAVHRLRCRANPVAISCGKSSGTRLGDARANGDVRTNGDGRANGDDRANGGSGANANTVGAS
jgi:hypothetical protein